MNKDIFQLFGKINPDDILRKKFYPVWFFTNERIADFFRIIEPQIKAPKKIYAIGGGGDFAFSLLSLFSNVEEINVCDVRQMACLTMDFKIALYKNFSFDEVSDFFQDDKTTNKNNIYQKIRNTFCPQTKLVFDSIIKNCPRDNFLKCLKKSGFWYKESFRRVEQKNYYLTYLNSENGFRSLQNNINKINIYFGDFNDNLNNFAGSYYDFIYVSNIFDHRKYCKELNFYCETLAGKLAAGGFLLIVAQDNHKKITKLMEKFGFHLCAEELHKFNLLTSLSRHYSYSFLLFKKTA